MDFRKFQNLEEGALPHNIQLKLCCNSTTHYHPTGA